jgi:hypothetical protein
MDVGNPYYQAACWAHSLTLAQQYAWNWLYYDNLVPYLRYITSGGTLTGADTNTAYTQATWQSAEEGLAAYIGSQAHSAGYPVVANTDPATLTPDTFTQTVASDLDGTMDQSFIDGGAGPTQQNQYWPVTIADATWAEANHKYFWAVPEMSSPTESENVYGLSAALMAMDGYTSYSTSVGPTGSCYGASCPESWYPEYNTALQLGPASGPYQARTSGGVTFYERDFANGVAVVNPSQNTVPSFTPTPGGVYTGSVCSAVANSCTTLASASTVSLNANGGAILLKSG